MRYIGLFLLLLAGYLAFRVYREELSQREKLLTEFISLLREHRHRVGFFLLPMSRWVGEFNSELLASLGVLSALEELSPREAFLGFKSRLELPASALSVLGDFFDYSGTADRALELSRCDSTLSALEKIQKEEKELMDSRLKLAGAIGFAILGGIVILML